MAERTPDGIDTAGLPKTLNEVLKEQLRQRLFKVRPNKLQEKLIKRMSTEGE
jgi:hypothetical protein